MKKKLNHAFILDKKRNKIKYLGSTNRDINSLTDNMRKKELNRRKNNGNA